MAEDKKNRCNHHHHRCTDNVREINKEQFAVLWTLFVLIVVGNSTVLIALFLDQKRKSRMNFFIMQLALADLTVGIFYVLTDIIWRMTVTWHAGNLGCKMIRFLQAVVIYSSTYVLVALSIDRYDAITHPMNFSGSSRRARVLVILAWSFSILFSIPMIILYKERYIQARVQCWIEFDEPWQWQIYMTLISIVLFFLPAIIISACYTIIVFTIWSKGKLLTHSSTMRNDDLDGRRASSRGLIPRAKIKTVKMTFSAVILNFYNDYPYFIFDLLQVFEYLPRTQTTVATATLIQSLAPLNSAANPLIYCAFSNRLCRTLR
ncbi:class A rhodopsin-like G-protein coupled receptor GPRvpr, putative [Pediculus humanus corporis]|uniref:Class A rhodopsin-like G-protein coupled receptor GPRvpr, putative n=1 Tax=Pediculus humanus subsp. corporis TaxID=121224 RepID=E0VFH7_PEDHC|nr:class A rhodopsin-like G-protein coupled receptor GPRvpr, putative [Pediculus humanus corporis]EEB12133.1 class A rhodopsin-like G-protein coupled receptor GPRvpr, putative [Pediculus humanus corporis]